jgi:GTP-binding protein Era
MSAGAPEGGQNGQKGFRSGFVAIVGRANVGKSTLLNRLLGEKVAIVSPVPQTTRHRLLGVVTRPDGQAAFIDGPGFHRAQHQLGELLLERASQTIEEADVVLFVIDATEGVGPGDLFVLEKLRRRVSDTPVIFVPNKLDAMNKARALPLIEKAIEEWGCREAIPVSAESGDNCERLLEVVVSLLPEGPALFPPDFRTDQDDRRLIAETVREQLLHRMRHELPHAIAVMVERTAEREDGLLEIYATIIVEKKSQKGIVIGKGGSMLKTVGSAARKELERRLERRIYLELWVKVREDWRDRISALRELGVIGG